MNCKALKTVYIPSTVTILESSTFSKTYQSKLEKIYIDKPENSISGAPWGAPQTTQVIWTG